MSRISAFFKSGLFSFGKILIFMCLEGIIKWEVIAEGHIEHVMMIVVDEIHLAELVLIINFATHIDASRLSIGFDIAGLIL